MKILKPAARLEAVIRIRDPREASTVLITLMTHGTKMGSRSWVSESYRLNGTAPAGGILLSCGELQARGKTLLSCEVLKFRQHLQPGTLENINQSSGKNGAG